MRRRVIFAALTAICFAIATSLPSTATANQPTSPKDEWSQVQDELSGLDAEIEAVTKDLEQRRATIEASTGEIAFLENAIAQGEAELAESNARVEKLRSTISERAVAAFTGRGTSEIASYDPEVFAEESARSVFVAKLAMTDDELIERIEAETETVREQQRQIAGRKAELDALVQTNEAAAAKLDEQLATLKAKEAELRAKGEKLAAMFVSSSGPVGPGQVCPASGFQVNCGIAEKVNRMVSAAAADGVRLSGHSFRNPSEQIALRKSNCGGSDHYTVYVKSPSHCSPATARPGSSMHERGLAIDFESCSSTGTACHQWMKRNGAAYGFFNLPGEPWHWSTNGQ